MKRFAVIAIYIFLFHLSSKAQTLVQLQDSLKTLSYKVINSSDELERYNASYSFIKTLVTALKAPNSYAFGFDSLKTISIQNSPDNKFRIFSWHVMNNDGSYRYYGTIQLNTNGKGLKLFPLLDQTALIKNPKDTVTSNEKWYGSQYYKIIPVGTNPNDMYYLLLGWKGNNPKTTKKVIDVLYFKDNKAVFGKPVFTGSKEFEGKSRIIFEYSRQVSMMLKFLEKENTIVFDHLAAPDPKLKDKYELIGPDMTYDGFKLVNGKWKLIEDLNLKNDPNESDNYYNDPKKPIKGVVDKLK